MRKTKHARRPPALTDHQIALLRGVFDGKTNAEIAVDVGLSPRTVETYRLRLMRQLELRNTVDLVKFALRQGIVRLDG